MAINRRSFIKKGTLAGLTLPALLISSCTSGSSENSQKVSTEPTNTDFSANFELNEVTVDELQRQMESGQYTARSITQMYLDRIKAIDQNGPALHSVIEINPDALAIADALDSERKAGKLRGPMHGIPVLIKDNIDSGDKMITSAGSLALAEHKAAKDAFIVAKLRESGAVLLGKTNLSEWANFRSERSSSGWSSRGGQTKNPYVLSRNPCGSSSGSGVAVSANLCVVAIGTETNGSITCPSSINGIVGIKPTVGLWSRSGIIPISHTQDTAGPMARTVKDAAILLGALTGIDTADAVTKESDKKAYTDYTQFLDTNGLQGKRIGIEKSFMKGHEAVDSLLQKTLELIKSQGATIVEVDLLAKLKEASSERYQVLLYEFKDGVNKYLATANAKVKTLKDVIEFNKKNESIAMPYFKQEILEESEAKGDLNSKEYKDAVKKSVTVSRNAIDSTMQAHQLDAIAGPSYGPSWCTDLINGDHFSGYGLSTPAATSGYPHITVPMGMVQGLPVGMSFFGAAYNEPQLITIAYAYEQATKNRVVPTFSKQDDLT